MDNFDIDPAGVVPISLRAGYDISFYLEFEDETTLTGTYELIFYTDKGFISSTTVLTLLSGSGITIAGNHLIFFLGYAANVLTESCFYLLRRTSGSSRVPIFTGLATIENE